MVATFEFSANQNEINDSPVTEARNPIKETCVKTFFSAMTLITIINTEQTNLFDCQRNELVT